MWDMDVTDELHHWTREAFEADGYRFAPTNRVHRIGVSPFCPRAQRELAFDGGMFTATTSEEAVTCPECKSLQSTEGTP